MKVAHQTSTRRRTFQAAVCFEFDQAPPITYRGAVLASRVRTGASMALRNAEVALKPDRWRSVVVLLTRAPDAEAS